MVKETKLKLDNFLKNVLSTDLFQLGSEKEKREFLIKLKQDKQSWDFLTRNIPKMSDYEMRFDDKVKKMIQDLYDGLDARVT